MLRLRLEFLYGRFHANPWGRHSNEGAAEWPPSPWRLLRALLSSWKRRPPASGEEHVESLLLRLAAAPPSFRVPPFSHGHLRQWVPVGDERRLLADAFIVIDPEDYVEIVWPELELSHEETETLDWLLQGVTYFGRSESLCRISRADDGLPPNVEPLRVGESHLTDLTDLLCPSPEVTIAQMAVTTKSLRSKGYQRPPGTRWITYRFLPSKVAVPPAPIDNRPPLFVLLTESSGPRLRRCDTLAVADRVRREILRLGASSPTLLGRVDGKPRTGPHSHLHILPDGPTNSQAVDRIILWASEGFGPDDLAVLARLRGLPAEAKLPAVPFLAYGSLDFEPEIQASSTVWESYTPYLAPRHSKFDGREDAESQLRRECALRGLPEPDVERLPPPDIRFELRRGPRRRPPGDPEWFRLTFPAAVVGPLCLGANSHFGMGRFLPVQPNS